MRRFPIEDQVSEAGIPNQIEVGVEDPDGDVVTVDYRIEPTPASFGGQKHEARIFDVTKGAIFSWTPTEDDVLSDGQQHYVLTFVASDGRGGRALRPIGSQSKAPFNEMLIQSDSLTH